MTNPHYQDIGNELWGSEAAKLDLLRKLERQGHYVAEPKRDGIWCSVEIDAAGVVIRSRTGRRKVVPELEAALASCGVERTVLIGELSVGTPEAVNRRKAAGHIVVDVFDVVMDRGRDISGCPLVNRRLRLVEMLDNPNIAEWLRLVPQWSCDFTQRYADEREGLVLKDIRSPYLAGQYHPGWIKVKKCYTTDYVVMSWKASSRRGTSTEPQASSVLCGAFDAHGDLIPLVCVPMLEDKLSRRIARDFDAYRGRVIEISHCGVFKGGSLRHPSFVRFRRDKTPAECTMARAV